MRIVHPAGHEVRDWPDWPRPKRPQHWKPGRSAMEAARAWFRSGAPACPAELQALLESNPHTASATLRAGFPEHVTPLPESGEGRNHDMIVDGDVRGVPLTLAIESKTYEPFGTPIARALYSARRRSPDTRFPARVEALLMLLTGEQCAPYSPPWRDLYYQLLSGVGGTIIEAGRRHARLAVFVVQEFIRPCPHVVSRERNDRALAQFVHTIWPAAPGIEVGRLSGPLPCRGVADLELFIGKIVAPIAESAQPHT